MKKIFFLIIISVIFTSCGGTDRGEVIGVQNREVWYQPDPYGMLYIPMGSYNMGANDNDLPYSQTSEGKTVSIQAFYMDETEITNNEYRQFVYWVRDSIARKLLGEEDEDTYLVLEDEFGEELDEPLLDWSVRIRWDRQEVREVLNEEMYYDPAERFYGRRDFDTRKFIYRYWWIDYKEAARKSTRDRDLGSGIFVHDDRSIFIKEENIHIYPDTLAWISDFTYSFNEPMTHMYFWHPAYDEYPVVGVNWRQAKAFNVWRTNLLNHYLFRGGSTYVQDFRLPTESEWEYAARAGLDLSQYPWGGPYIRNSNGCFLGNFKPLRGNYVDDGGFHTVKVNSYSPNDFGLYCMSGNVGEWTSNAFDPSAYNFAHDLNMDYQYNAADSEAETLKRKVIRGGSWKDVGYYLQTSTRTYEYQDTAKCYVGFRSVMSYLGRAKGDDI
jgi:formylglycine-generating enzyme